MKRTLSMKRLSRAEREELRSLSLGVSELFSQRPRIRGECQGGERPCPWVSCKYHLYLDINPKTGSIKLNWRGEPWEMPQTCALDVAERAVGINYAGTHQTTLTQISTLIGLARERARQIEAESLAKLRSSAALQEVVE